MFSLPQSVVAESCLPCSNVTAFCMVHNESVCRCINTFSPFLHDFLYLLAPCEYEGESTLHDLYYKKISFSTS